MHIFLCSASLPFTAAPASDFGGCQVKILLRVCLPFVAIFPSSPPAPENQVKNYHYNKRDTSGTIISSFLAAASAAATVDLMLADSTFPRVPICPANRNPVPSIPSSSSVSHHPTKTRRRPSSSSFLFLALSQLLDLFQCFNFLITTITTNH